MARRVGRFIAAAVFSAVLVAVPAAAAPGDMTVETFLTKTDALMAKGPLALFSADVGRLRTEATAAGVGYANRLKAERADGHPSSCPPRGVKPDQDMWLAHLRSYPEPVRSRTNLHVAMADLYKKKWPCR